MRKVCFALIFFMSALAVSGCIRLQFKPFAKAEKGRFVTDEQGTVRFVKGEPKEKKGTEKPKQKGAKGEKKMEEVAVIRTAKGEIVFKFFSGDAPKAVQNFIKLANEKFYDGLLFHRVVKDFVIQGGDPKGDGSGGPGYAIPDEFNARPHLEGTVGMARTQEPNSGGSQFYICLAPQPQLDGKYTVFGQVADGLDVIHEIEKGDTIESIRIEEREVAF